MLRADARDPWRIVGPAPSPRGVIGILRRWWRSWSAWALSMLDDIPDSAVVEPSDVTAIVTRMTAQAETAPPVPLERYALAAGPIATRAGRDARSGLVRAGMPADVVAMRAGDMRADVFDVELVAGIDLLGSIERAALIAWAQDGVDYIQAVPRRLLTNLPEKLAAIAADGGRWETLRDQLRGELGVGERHLELIARDQVAKLNSRVTQAMHAAAGVTHYRWRANLDERTRRSHRNAHDTVVAWDSAGVPGTGFYGEPAHAGQAGQCRCTAEPVVEL